MPASCAAAIPGVSTDGRNQGSTGPPRPWPGIVRPRLPRMLPGYAEVVLRDMRTPAGGPNAAVRLIALLIVLGLVVATAPVVMLPVLRWLGGHLL